MGAAFRNLGMLKVGRCSLNDRCSFMSRIINARSFRMLDGSTEVAGFLWELSVMSSTIERGIV